MKTCNKILMSLILAAGLSGCTSPEETAPGEARTDEPPSTPTEVRSGSTASESPPSSAEEVGRNVKTVEDVEARDAVQSDPATPPTVTPLGELDTGDGAWVLGFDELPGENEKPKTKIRTVSGRVAVYEIYDWAEHHEELSGQTGHVWYRVEPDEGHWVYGLAGFEFYPTAKTSN